MSEIKELTEAIAVLKSAGDENDFAGPIKLLEERLEKAIVKDDEGRDQFGTVTEVKI